MIIRSFLDEARFDRFVSLFRIGQYSPEHLKNYPNQGYGAIFFTTMDPNPGVLAVEVECSIPQD
jgi:hypothetical protein